jgi:hypothetical protein
MHNYHGKKPLYEAIRDSKAKAAAGKGVRPLQPQGQADSRPVQQETKEPLQTLTHWPIKPRFVQFNAGRIELSLPYQLVIAILLAGIVLLLVVFRLGQYVPAKKSAQRTTENARPVQKAAALKPAAIAATKSPVSANASAVETSRSKGTNKIVIQAHQNSAELEPVKDYFASNGIEMEIRKIGNWYYLVTKEKFDNPEKAGTDGAAMKQRIIELGEKYEAPAGYGSFGPKPFSDAYGMRFDD